MEQCARCGHTLGIGRYCVNCGQPRDQTPDDWRSGTAERPAVAADPAEPPPAPPSLSPPTEVAEPTQSPWGPASPPPVYETPPQARYPMYADEPVAPVTSVSQPAVWDHPSSGGSHRERRPVLPWVLVGVALLLVAATGVFLLVGGGDDDETADDPSSGGASSQATDTGPSEDPTTSTDPPSSEPVEPTTTPPPGEGEDVARGATAIAPSTAPPGRDVNGNAVRYEARNMLDGQDDTAWRTPGDASGGTIGFDLAAPTRLSQVGLLNGYAKSDPGYDGYTANRRILEVEWVFADGSVVAQTLDGTTREVQTIDVDVETTSVQLRILSVSRPGRGPSGRDFTAISTVRLVGVPA